MSSITRTVRYGFSLAAILTASMALASPNLNAQASWTPVLDEAFLTPWQGSPGRWSCDAPISVPGGWYVANGRADFQSSSSGHVVIQNGTARLFDTTNSASGGYLAFYHPLDGACPLTSWRITVEIRSNAAVPDRPIPQMTTSHVGQSGLPCAPLFADPDTTGWQLSSAYEVTLRDPSQTHVTNYTMAPGSGWHTIELTSTSSGSELRVWPRGGTRPQTAQASGASLGRARRVLFMGPNYRNFDYEVDRVQVERMMTTGLEASVACQPTHIALQLCGTPGHVFALAFAVARPGQCPNGWFGGLDLTPIDFPFLGLVGGMIGSQGTSVLLPGQCGALGVDVDVVALEFTPNQSFLGFANCLTVHL